MFVKTHFSPSSVQGAKAPRTFSYENVLDTMNEMKQPGYFNDARIVLRPNSRIDVIASDFHGSLFVMGIVDDKVCVYKNDIRCRRGEAVLPKPVELKTPVKKKKTKAA